MEKTALKAAEKEEKRTYKLKMTSDEYENLTAASGKLKALLRTMHDALHSGNEINISDFSWLFIYAEDELSVLNKAIAAIEGLEKSSKQRIKEEPANKET